MPDLAFLRTFMAIYRSGSLTRAARSLRMTQPAVSQHLRGLETQVGRALFQRHARGVAATPAAHELASRAGAHLDALAALGEDLRAAVREPRGTVHVGGPVDLIAQRVVPTLAAHPDVARLTVVVRPGLERDVLDMLGRGDLDVVVTRESCAAGMSCEMLMMEDARLVTGAEGWRKIEHLDIDARVEALARGPLVSFVAEMPVVREFFRVTIGHEVDGAPALIVPDLRAVAAAVRAGVGSSVLPGHVVASMIERGELFEVRPRTRPTPTPLFVATLQGVRDVPRIALVRRVLLEAAAGW
jgi:DNA-binding transcriptional LysR family regulator